MVSNEELVSGYIRGNTPPPNFVRPRPAPMRAGIYDEVVPALSKIAGIGAFKVNTGSFVPPNEIPNYNMPTSRMSASNDATMLVSRGGDKMVGLTDGRPIAGFVEQYMSAPPVPSALDDYLSSGFRNPVPVDMYDDSMNMPEYDDSIDRVVQDEQAQIDELAYIEEELANNEQLGQVNRRRIQDLIFT